MPLAELIVSPLILITASLLIITLIMLAVALSSRKAKKRANTNVAPFYPSYQPNSPQHGQDISQSKDRTAILIAIISAIATVVSALITALVHR